MTTNPLANKHITLAVTGGIAAYKACELVRLFVKAGAVVQVVMTEAAARFVGPLTFETLSGRPVALDLFSGKKIPVKNGTFTFPVENGKSYSKETIEKKLDDLLEELQITRLRTNTAMSLSGGERRRTEIARALAAEPKFILLDEPFAGVDPIAVIEIQRIIRFLKNRGIGVLITDHNVRETLGICDHAYIICDGGVLASGHPKDIVQNEDVRRAYLGEAFRM